MEPLVADFCPIEIRKKYYTVFLSVLMVEHITDLFSHLICIKYLVS